MAPPAPVPGPGAPQAKRSSADHDAPPKHVRKEAFMARNGQQPARRTSNYPSPGPSHSADDGATDEFVNQCEALDTLLRAVRPDVVRRVVRDNWERCLIGTPFHQGFVLNAALHHASGPSAGTAVHKFGPKLISKARDQLVAQFTAADLDIVAPIILENASDRFLDQLLQARLFTIGPTALTNALARAERLGYELSDIQPEEPAATSSTQPAAISAPPAQPAPSGSAEPSAIIHCPACRQGFGSMPPYLYHTSRRLCQIGRSSPAAQTPHQCSKCLATFADPASLAYHCSENVCGGYSSLPPLTSSSNPVLATMPGPVGAVNKARLSVCSLAHRSLPNMPPRSSPIPAVVSSTPATAPANSAPTANTPAGGTPASSSRWHSALSLLTPQQRDLFENDMKAAEVIYNARKLDAEDIQDPAARKARLDSLRNSFATKQSNIRKKHGVRLHDRRKRAEIDADRGSAVATPSKPSPLLYATNQPAPAGLSAQHAASVSTSASPADATHAAAERSVPWTHNTTHDWKRRRVETGPGVAQRALPLAAPGVSSGDLSNGLNAASSTPALQDPTLPSGLTTGFTAVNAGLSLSFQGRPPLASAAVAIATQDPPAGDSFDSSDDDSDGSIIPARLPSP